MDINQAVEILGGVIAIGLIIYVIYYAKTKKRTRTGDGYKDIPKYPPERREDRRPPNQQ